MSLDPMLVVLQFNQCITDCDLKGIAELISADYVFIPANGPREHGRDKAITGWAGFFHLYPDYRNILELVTADGNRVIACGHAECEYEPLAMPVIWSALVKKGKVSEWRKYRDTPENRTALGLPAG